jgi:hypothetical protein
MNVKEALRRIRRYVEAFEASLDYDPCTDIRLRIERLEQQVADLNARMLTGAPTSLNVVSY